MIERKIELHKKEPSISERSEEELIGLIEATRAIISAYQKEQIIETEATETAQKDRAAARQNAGIGLDMLDKAGSTVMAQGMRKHEASEENELAHRQVVHEWRSLTRQEKLKKAEQVLAQAQAELERRSRLGTH